ncbi:hypothetical protein A2333_03300 [Candidatus Wolfebacteria bacterium RIFOXYB2_FULL_49_7]|uniref:NYN domain-containing protein n=1 Tax=Candidatus Wolfebacteria bacterium RIFOXYB1_FULL_54_12 TaxID=1802559 RepID=A0A1F8DVL3_9BACT|nr:MAG: hypothetical protein A2372_04245 [Candidatus Wolfebacteria bacterium RIFOXYB1_FULL_54_12]OGM95551.1 MAG: hypothetical protein A2333_03300 [Candidatus Wolfebacteria bacterium RIFOXYB2_FULL_49_7]
MKKEGDNFAFIDGQNLNLSIKRMGWSLDFKRFRIYLQEKYSVKKAYYFIGYIEGNQNLYTSLQEAGYILVFKPTLKSKDGIIKGNVDAELVLHTMIEYPNYNKAVIVSSDGDFACLVNYLEGKNKLERVLAPNRKAYSVLLRKSGKGKSDFMDDLRGKLEYKKKTP